MEILGHTHGSEVGTAGAGALLRMLRRRRWFILFVVVPVLFATVFYELIAADEYQSESRFVIKAPAQKQGQVSSIANLIQSTGMSSGQDQTNEVIDYIQSREALRDLEKKTNVKSKFSSSSADLISRYPALFKEDKFENLYKYYKGMVKINIDHDTNSAVLTVKAFNAADARSLNLHLLELSEELINRLNARFQTKAISEAEKRVADAEMRVRNARIALREYRNSHDVMDPKQEATGVLDVSNKLVSDQALLRAQLEAMQNGAVRNPAIPALRSRIAAIGEEIAAQNHRAVGTVDGLASKLTTYEALQVDQEFATQMLTMSSATLEQARTEALKQQYYLERVVEPDQPDVAMYPKRFQDILVVGGAALALYMIGWMLIVGILEHSPED